MTLTIREVQRIRREQDQWRRVLAMPGVRQSAWEHASERIAALEFRIKAQGCASQPQRQPTQARA